MLAVAVSGGRDSTALLHAVWRQSAGSGLQIVALHVHHGLMPQADGWLAHVQAQCARWHRRDPRLSFLAQRLTGRPPAGESVEAWARRERYAALAAMAKAAGAREVWLAHHQRDQAETVLLQALRGAGPAGLAAMPARIERQGVIWVRPWLQQPVEAIAAYVARHRLKHIEDDSNADPRFARNRLRLQVLPALAQAFPQAQASLAEVAHQAQVAMALIDEVAQADLAVLGAHGEALPLAEWAKLSPARRRFSLKAWLATCYAGPVSEAQLARLLAGLAPGASAGPARWPLSTSQELRLYRGRLTLHATRNAHPPPSAQPEPGVPLAAGFAVPGCGRFALPAWGGELEIAPAQQGGISPHWLLGARLVARQGAEQFQAAPRAQARSLKKQFQAAGVPAWERQAPLLVASATRGGVLLFVPGLGVDARVCAAPGQPQWQVHWHRV